MNEKEKFNYYLSKLEDEGYFYDHFEYDVQHRHFSLPIEVD